MSTKLRSDLLPANVPRQAGGPGRGMGSLRARFAAMGGLLFFGLIVAFGSLTSNMPAATGSRQEIFSYVTQHNERLQVAAALYALAMAAALVFLSGLFDALRKAEGGRPHLAMTAFAGGVLAAAATVTGALVLGTTATRVSDLGPAGARVFWTMFLLSIGGTLVGQFVMIGATAVVSLRTRLFSTWFGTLSVVLALASAAGGMTIGSAAVAVQVIAGVTVVLNAVWILVVSTVLWRRPDLASP